ncbi:MAG: hypothetical protein IJ201_10765 [Solobacterium sp.]|nr:hypothetical protein [Solobacterium sp.]
MKKKRIPLFSGWRRRHEEARREEAHKMIVTNLEKTMKQQRARVLKVTEKPTQEPVQETSEDTQK